MSTTKIDLSSLPEPDIIENLQFEEIYQARKDKIIQLDPKYTEMLTLESDPMVVNLQAESYRELLLRQRINEAALSQLLAKAAGPDLDHLGHWYGVSRVQYEEDDVYQDRLIESLIAVIQSQSDAMALVRTTLEKMLKFLQRNVLIQACIARQLPVNEPINEQALRDQLLISLLEHLSEKDISFLEILFQPFSGSELDRLAKPVIGPRITEENDEDFRLRIRQATIASSTAGSKVHYEQAVKESAPTEIKDFTVSSPKGSQGEVHISVLAHPSFDQDTIRQKVENHVKDDKVRMLTDTVTVKSAREETVDITATVKLQPNADKKILDQMEQRLIQVWDESARLGWDLTMSWLLAQLHLDGVQEVRLLHPTESKIIEADQYVKRGVIDLSLQDDRSDE